MNGNCITFREDDWLIKINVKETDAWGRVHNWTDMQLGSEWRLMKFHSKR